MLFFRKNFAKVLQTKPLVKTTPIPKGKIEISLKKKFNFKLFSSEITKVQQIFGRLNLHLIGKMGYTPKSLGEHGERSTKFIK